MINSFMKLENNNSEDAIFVDENRNVFKGEEALKLIQARKSEVIDIDKGVTSVDVMRWEEAQRYERRTWMEGIAAMSDRNEDHEDRFGGYGVLAGKKFTNAIELGCGPFTNMRKILRHCEVDFIHLLDPLARDYLDHPFCRYKNKKIGGILKTTLLPWTRRGGFKHPKRFCRHKWDEWKVGRLFGRPISLYVAGIEDFIPPRTFDLCVMINVIEHCRDIEKIFSRILEMTFSGSYFVFADKIYHADEEARLSNFRFDAGHPLRVDYAVIQEFLRSYFKPIWDAEISCSEGTDVCNYNYFIGIRK